MLRNTEDSYGLVAIALHWLVAVVVLALFALGLWMTGLDYYDPWYRRAPDLHKSVGALLFVTLILRLAWRIGNPRPRPEPTLSTLERTASRLAHALLYPLLFAVMTAGYLISTADGRPLNVFGLVAVPATVTGLPNQADLAGDAHLILAIAVITLAVLHALGALKHHFIDRDRTLLRMLGRSEQRRKTGTATTSHRTRIRR
jgi:cytochrome b561